MFFVAVNSLRGSDVAKKTASNSIPVITSRRFCAARFPAPPKLSKKVSPQRARLIRETASRWLNGTPLRYWFFDSPTKWTAPKKEQDVVRAAFKSWKALGIGLDFVEVKKTAEADIRIAFQQGDGSWSYVGTDIRTNRRDPRTMNFGWSLTEDPQDGMDTAIHEIGHTLGFPHEHQNPFAGIVWNEEAVYKSLAAPPNQWSRSTTFHNIIEKIVPDSVKGSNWDPDSVMHYPFEPGLILKPDQYSKGLRPAGGLSPHDKEWVQTFYPPLKASDAIPLVPFQSVPLSLKSGQQIDFSLSPTVSRPYVMQTFGNADTVMALFEEKPSGQVQLAADNDSGVDRNARITMLLSKGKKYTLRVRLNVAAPAGEAAVMLW
jgi:hypothetical protein